MKAYFPALLLLPLLAGMIIGPGQDGKPEDDFQKRALRAITGGEKEVSAVEKDMFRYAGVIVLQNQCLKCHVPERTSLNDRFAALEITMQVKPAGTPAKP